MLTTPHPPMSPLDAAYHAAHQYPGGASAVAMRLGKAPGTLCHELTATGSAKLGLMDAVAMSQLLGTTAIAHAFCAQLGGVFMPAGDAAASGNLEALGSSIREFGEFAAKFSQVMADGRVTPRELRELEREALQAIGAITQVLSLANRAHDDGLPGQLRAVKAA